ncbi:MAG: Asp-tRNA(Asn)/Glu-tRNA(Gln) amidotransferase subunit GatC [Terriglobales bacterium]
MNVNLHHIASLAALELTPEEAEGMQRDLSSILEYVSQLQRWDVSAAEPMAHIGALLPPQGGVAPAPPEASLRDDQARPGLSTAAALDNAPARAHGLFEVPKILERG